MRTMAHGGAMRWGTLAGLGAGGGMDRILEIGGLAAGVCGRALAAAGHEVVRVEAPGRAPARVSPETLALCLHAGKRQVETRDPGRIEALAREADVVIAEAESADALEALGFDRFESQLTVAITPFGRTGPDRNRPATTATLLARAGYTIATGDPDRMPLCLPVPLPEWLCGHLVTAAVHALRIGASGSGRGRRSLDVSLLEVLVAQGQPALARWQTRGELWHRSGSAQPTVAPSGLFACRDGFVQVHVPPDFFDGFAIFVGRPELVVDPRFATPGARLANRAALDEIVRGVLADRAVEDVLVQADAQGIPCGRVTALGELIRILYDDAGELRVSERAWRTASPREVADA